MNENILKFQEVMDDKFWDVWNKNHSPKDWDDWLKNNNIKKMKYSEDGSEYSKIREKYKIKATERHICVFNTFAHMYEEEYKLLLVPYDLALKSAVLGFMP